MLNFVGVPSTATVQLGFFAPTTAALSFEAAIFDVIPASHVAQRGSQKVIRRRITVLIANEIRIR